MVAGGHPPRQAFCNPCPNRRLPTCESADRIWRCCLKFLRPADEAALRKAKRDKLLATHPDKLGGNAIGANLAVGRVTLVRTRITVYTDAI